jgi:uncharacterized protein YbaP (TraB family)
MRRVPPATLLWLLGLLVGLVSSCAPAEPPATQSGTAAAEVEDPSRRALLWTATHPDGGNIALFGTMHLSDPRITRLPAEAEAAFESADAVWTELIANQNTQSALLEAGRWQNPNDSLWKALGPELSERFREEAINLGQSPEVFEPLRPWMAEVAFAQLSAAPYLKGSETLDVKLLSRARAAGKEVGAVETTEEQLAALASGSIEQQVHRLSATLERNAADRAAGRDRMREQVDAYLAGDAEALWRQAEEVLDPQDKIMLGWWNMVYVQRNQRMTERIQAIVRNAPDKQYLFAFGALHFTGSPSVIDGLRGTGWTVTRVPAANSSE